MFGIRQNIFSSTSVAKQTPVYFAGKPKKEKIVTVPDDTFNSSGKKNDSAVTEALRTARDGRDVGLILNRLDKEANDANNAGIRQDLRDGKNGQGLKWK